MLPVWLPLEVYFSIGALLDDPNRVFICEIRKLDRKIEYRRIEEVDEDGLLGLLKQALDMLPYFKEHWKEIQAG